MSDIIQPMNDNVHRIHVAQLGSSWNVRVQTVDIAISGGHHSACNCVAVCTCDYFLFIILCNHPENHFLVTSLTQCGNASDRFSPDIGEGYLDVTCNPPL
jgi:hypothetical protein